MIPARLVLATGNPGKVDELRALLSGWGWVDTSYQKFGPSSTDTSFTTNNIKYWKGQARMLLRLTPTYAIDSEYFLQGQVELVGTGDQTIQRSEIGGADTDDLWLRIGKWNSWDIQAGRFEGWEVFHLGMGLDFNTFERRGAVAPANPGIGFYGLTDNQFRPGGSSTNVAAHVYPFSFLRFEALGMAGTFASGPVYAVRPVGILDFGWVKFKVGTEYQKIVARRPDNAAAYTLIGMLEYQRQNYDVAADNYRKALEKVAKVAERRLRAGVKA